MSDDLKQLYQEIILDHYRSPRNRGTIEGGLHAAGHNPLCGDRVEVYLEVDDESGGPVVRRATFEGAGCAISTATASLMTEALAGKTVDEARELSARFRRMVRGEEEPSEHDFGELEALAGVRRIPVRVKCATLAWHTFEAALDRSADGAETRPVTTESTPHGPAGA